MSAHIVLRMTPSQQMALQDLVVDYITRGEHLEEFVNVVDQTTITTDELLTLVTWGEIPEKPCTTPSNGSASSTRSTPAPPDSA